MKEANFEYSLAAIQKCRILMAQFITVGVLLSDSLNFVASGGQQSNS